MNAEELHELRERVERRRRREAEAALLRESKGQHNKIDSSVVYLTTKEAAEILGVHRKTINNLAHAGDLPRAMKSKSNGHSMWAIHPGDLEPLKSRFLAFRKEKP